MSPIIQDKAEQTISEVLALADISINGPRPWDIQVHSPEFYNHLLSNGSLALGESYMAGWWDAVALDQLFFRILRSGLEQKIRKSRAAILCGLKATLSNCQNKKKALEVGKKHYDVGNDLFESMLDKHMTYSCAYWQNGTHDLTAAQEAKLDLICRKIELEPGMRVLDIGCGWGSFVRYAAQNYGVEAVGVTISTEQAKLARTRCAGLPIDIRLQDYRDLSEQFDAIVSVGMFEHVGYKNYRQFMQVVNRCLKPEALFLLHTIGSNKSSYHGDPWIDKYIFPNGMLPSIEQVGKASEELLVMEDWHNMGVHYDKTLTSWFANFDRSWPKLKDSYNDTFYRMWKYYLLSLAGVFRARKIQVWQVVLSQNGRLGSYQSHR
ncbi:MAG: cyclopropane fatty acyl phospholipid synthase [Desulfurivibrionaceae bacterium]|nr:cyclopropane fatty acyl phospholipid synthase [Desulfurivibrionaceae bacterium]